MTDYKAAAEKAKAKFAKRLKRVIATREITLVEAEGESSITAAHIGLGLRDSSKISEPFIRKATNIKGMETCYSEYRNEVDAPYLAEDKSITQSQEAREQIDKALALIIASLQDVRKNLQDL